MKWDSVENVLIYRTLVDAQRRVYDMWAFVIEGGHHFSRELNMKFIELYIQRKDKADAFFDEHCAIL